MTVNESYERYLLELQANGTTDKLQSSKGEYVVNYNKHINRLVEYYIERKQDDDNRYIQLLKIIDKEVNLNQRIGNKDIFELPENYFDFIDVNSYASNDNCSNQLFNLKEVKGENVNQYLTDEFSKPSFKFRESIYQINNNNITLYTDNFRFTKTFLSYYRKPQYIQLQDPDNPESQFVNEEIEFDDKFTNRVITLAASGHSLNIDDQKYQALVQGATSKI